MKKSILQFPNHIDDALQIKNNFFTDKVNYNSVIISGQGGSAIGGFLIYDLLDFKNSTTPLIINQGYNLPKWASNKTLLIISSYSGNTEETINVYKQGIKNNCKIICLTSGGALLESAIENKIEYILLPSGFQPRAAIAYSIVQLFKILKNKNINLSFSNLNFNSFKNVASFLKENQRNIINQAKKIADLIDEKISILYCSSLFYATALRFKQQINENSKSHCWFNIIPEMNHNEIEAYTKNANINNFIIIWIDDKDIHPRNKRRLDISKSILSKKIKKQIDIRLDLNNVKSSFVKYLIYINLMDWISYYAAILKNVDPSIIPNINELKKSL